MDELIILEIEGRATPDELDELGRWRAAAPANEERYQEVRALWALTGMRREIHSGLEPPSAAEVLGRTRRPARRRGFGGRLAGGAAAIAASLVLALGIGQIWSGGQIGTPTALAAEFRTGPNELMTAVLDDGSVARLAPNTTLTVTMVEGGREAQLEGRAFFAVSHDPDRPFRVHTSEGDVTVLGTRFEVDTARSSLRLLVVDGAVSLSASGTETELTGGDLGESTAEGPPVVTRVEVPEALLDWMGTWMAFEATPLYRVAQELEVRLGIHVQIADAGISQRTFSGWFSEQDRDRMLEMICRVAELRCTRVDDVVVMEDWS